MTLKRRANLIKVQCCRWCLFSFNFR